MKWSFFIEFLFVISNVGDILGFFIVHVQLFYKKSSIVTKNVCHQHCSIDVSRNQGHFLLIRILIFVTY